MSSKSSKYGSALVIDDHKMIGNGIKLLIGDLFEKIHLAFDGASGISTALQTFPQLIIVDYFLPDTTGELLVRKLREKFPEARILAFTFTYSAEAIVKLLQSGINGYIIKKDKDEDFIKAVHLLMQGKEYFCQEARLHIMNHFSGKEDNYSLSQLITNIRFTSKEIDIIRLLCKQLSTKEISTHLGLSERTVEKYRSKITRRIGGKNIVAVIRFALQNGIIQLDEL